MFNWKGERNLAFLLYSLVLVGQHFAIYCFVRMTTKVGLAPEARRGRNQGETSPYKKTPGRIR